MKCRRCSQNKDPSDFHRNSSRSSGFSCYCCQCKRELDAADRKKHLDERRRKARVRYAKDPERVRDRNRRAYAKHIDRRKSASKVYREAHKEEIRNRAIRYRASHREQRNAHETARRAADPLHKLRVYLRSRLNKHIRGKWKSASHVRDLGCSLKNLKTYIESLFLPGMSWDNRSPEGWHLDHIRPLASFDLSDPEQLKQAVHYTNLQPLWAADNMAKGSRVPELPLGIAVCHQPSDLGRQP